MILKWKEFDIKKEKDLLTILNDDLLTYDDGVLETLRSKVSTAIKVHCGIIKLLYKKKIINKKDIIQLLASYIDFELMNEFEIICK